MKAPKASKAGGKSLLSVNGAPTAVITDEDFASPVDLSSITFKYKGSKKTIVTMELSVTAGTLDALGTADVTVAGIGTDTLTFTGTPVELEAYFAATTSVTYTSAPDDFGINATSMSFGHVTAFGTDNIATTQVDINDVTDDFIGTNGDDTITGERGMNIILGLDGRDFLDGLQGVDTIDGGAGDDVIRGGADGDTLIGGAGEDTLQYSDSDAGVTINLETLQASGGHATGDTISGFENVYGTEFDDVLTGDANDNVFIGYGGSDIIDGGAGNDVIRGGKDGDTLIGGAGIDWLRYVDSDAGVTVDLNADAGGFQSASGGDAQGDIVSEFENVYGSDFGDVLTGDAGDNYFLGYDGDDTIIAGDGRNTVRGGEGNDTITGGAGRDMIRGDAGADTMAGGADVDTLQYAGSSAGVTVDLNVDLLGFQSATGGDATGDVISEFENVYGSSHGDTLTGAAGRNYLYGYDGDDVINGGDGRDVIRGGNGADTFVFNTALGPGNVDRILDYKATDDTMHLDSLIFTGLAAGAFDASQFTANATGLAEDALQRIIYDSGTGNLHFDADGNGAGADVVFATLTAGLAIDETDFFIL